MSFSLQEDASTQIPLATAKAIFETAFSAWLSADCGAGERPRLQAEQTEPVACRAHEYNQKDGNANVILFRDDAWPYHAAGTTLALTTVTYNLDTAEIYDADMELNSATTQFSTGEASVTFDLLSIATHEVGHFLGLSHTPDHDGTMYADYAPGSITLRDLAPDDVAAICAAYPPGDPVPSSCDPTPRHGFSSTCSDASDAPEQDGCSMTHRTPGARQLVTLFAAAVALIAWSARRRGG